MVRIYHRKIGSRTYKNYSEEDVAKAVAAVRSGQLSQNAAAKKYKVGRITIHNRLHGKHGGKIGHPTVLTPEEEKLISETLGTVADWGNPLTKTDICEVIKTFVSKQGRTVAQWNDNRPSSEFVNDFAARNNLTQRVASNIKIQRASVGRAEISEYFENLRAALDETRPEMIFNYDETNITDDPGAKKVLVPRGRRRVERVKEHSKSSVSLMFCGTASGELLPPMVVYKSKNVYENWTKGGPPGTIYRNSWSGWFDTNLFEEWFLKILLPHIENQRIGEEKVVVIGDNLASHFSPEVVKLALANNIYFTTLAPSSTHMLQPLDVGVFAPLKKKWRQVLDKWRQESRRKGLIPKEQFPLLLQKLMDGIAPNIAKNLKSGFKATGLYPFDPEEVLRKLPGEQNTARVLDESLLAFLKETRGYNEDRVRHRRGKKIAAHKPGAQILETEKPASLEENIDPIMTVEDNDVQITETIEPENSQEYIDLHNVPSTSGIKKRRGKEKLGQSRDKRRARKPMRFDSSSDDDVLLSDLKRNLQDEDSNNLCTICQCDYQFYSLKTDWIRCITCGKWVCGQCNKGSKNPSYECERCEDE